jgi:DNA ligase D-like protein (predicted ligase)
VEPQLASADAGSPVGPGWLLERKLDGIRVAAHVHDGALRLVTRQGNDRAGTFPELRASLLGLGTDLVLDGEVVAFEGDRDRFGWLQRRLGAPGRPTVSAAEIPVELHVFDLLHLEGLDLRRLPLRARRRMLEALPLRPPLHLVATREDDPTTALAEACGAGWEGLIAKRADGPYRPGRSHDWRKLKCERTGWFVVGGWTRPQGRRQGLGALLVGTVAGDGLHYAGRVGTGFDDGLLATLSAHLERAATDASPFVDPPDDPGLLWVVPHLVVEVRFTGWTDAGRLRHPSWRRVRPDLAIADALGEL